MRERPEAVEQGRSRNFVQRINARRTAGLPMTDVPPVLTGAAAGSAHGVETPSGKGAGDENFPVGSFLLPRSLRPRVAIFYAYARAIDDIADNPNLAAVEKIERLDGFDKALAGATDDPAFTKAIRVRETMADTGDIIRHCRDLVVAFKQDAVKGRYADWDELIDYCNHSAAPVGRFLLDLHGCSRDAYPASDALCNALQVINHLQDCQADYLNLDRVYLPQDWMAEEGASVADLARPETTPALRRVLDRCLDATEALLAVARPLPGRLSSRRLAMESAAIHRLAVRLCVLLRRRDPLATRVALSKAASIGTAARGVVRYWLGGYR
jgi:squalene synthase HpnC